MLRQYLLMRTILQIVRGDQFRQPVGDALVDLDFHDHPVGGQHWQGGGFLVQRQLWIWYVRRVSKVTRNPRSYSVPINAWRVVTHDADRAQVVLPEIGINFFDHGLIFGGKVFRGIDDRCTAAGPRDRAGRRAVFG